MFKSRRTRWAGNVEGRIYIIGGKARGKETTRKPRHRWVDDIKMDLVLEIGWDGMVWTGLIWLRTQTSGELL
jgi:hypothetical protein